MKTAAHKDNLEVCLPISILLTGLYGLWSSMKITLILEKRHFHGRPHEKDQLEIFYYVDRLLFGLGCGPTWKCLAHKLPID